MNQPPGGQWPPPQGPPQGPPPQGAPPGAPPPGAPGGYPPPGGHPPPGGYPPPQGYPQQPGYPPQGYAQPQKKSNAVWIILGIVGVLVFGCGGLVCVGVATGDRSNSSGSDDDDNDDVDATEVSAEELIQEYKANEVAADDKYKGEWVEVTGTVDRIAKDILDAPYVTMRGGELFEGVQAYPKNSKDEHLSDLSKGDEITVKCKVDGKMINVMLKRCTFVD